jgi:hypothetical protein
MHAMSPAALLLLLPLSVLAEGPAPLAQAGPGAVPGVETVPAPQSAISPLTQAPDEDGSALPEGDAATDDSQEDRGGPGKRRCRMGGMGHGQGGHGMGRHGLGGPGKGGGVDQGRGGHGDRHQEVVQRLDLMEARMAKIESMLETLLRR